jgi:hypothetical protein
MDTTNNTTDAAPEFRCFFTGKPTAIAELVEVDGLMESLGNRVGEENYEEFLDALETGRTDPAIQTKAPYVHKFKGRGATAMNVSKKAYDDAITIYESNGDETTMTTTDDQAKPYPAQTFATILQDKTLFTDGVLIGCACLADST